MSNLDNNIREYEYRLEVMQKAKLNIEAVEWRYRKITPYCPNPWNGLFAGIPWNWEFYEFRIKPLSLVEHLAETLKQYRNEDTGRNQLLYLKGFKDALEIVKNFKP